MAAATAAFLAGRPELGVAGGKPPGLVLDKHPAAQHDEHDDGREQE